MKKHWLALMTEIGIADACDSLASDRPSRKGLSPAETRDKAFEPAFRKQQRDVPEVPV
jgi:hypothetical protein